MSDPFAESPLPRWPLLAAGGLIALTLTATAAVRLMAPDQAATAEAPPVSRALRFEDRSDGGIVIIDALSGRELDVDLGPNDGFLRATMRALARERRQHGVGSGPAFRLSVYADGRLTLEDPATGRRIDLSAFGPTNAGAFARLLPAKLQP